MNERMMVELLNHLQKKQQETKNKKAHNINKKRWSFGLHLFMTLAVSATAEEVSVDNIGKNQSNQH